MAAATMNPSRVHVPISGSSREDRDVSTQTKKVKPSCCKVTTEFFRDKWPDVAKSIYTAEDWAKRAGVISSPYAATTSQIAHVAKGVKLFGGIANLPGKVYTAAQSIAAFTKDPSAKKLGRAGLDVVGCVSPVFDTIDLMQHAKIHRIPETTMTVLKGVNYGALGVSMTYGAGEAIAKIADSGLEKAKTPEERAVAKGKISQSTIDLIKCVAYVGLAIVGLLFVFGAVALTPLVSLLMLSFSTVSLVATIWGYFNNAVHDPYGKNKV